MPVRSRDDGGARAHGVRQRTARYLGLVEIRADEHVGRLQVFAQLLGGDELAAKDHVLAHAELVRFELERGPVRFAVAPHDGWMSRADDEIDDVRKAAHDLGQGADYGFDALVGAQQAEREQQASIRYAELRFQRSLVAALIHHGDAVRDDANLRAANAVRRLEQILRNAAHHDDGGAELEQLPDDGGLVLRRLLEHRMQRDY